jgi:dTDP-4-dehydrorhamnose 3,5-epimerase
LIFYETPLKGAYTIELEKRGDDRGFFARFFCTEEFSKQGLSHSFAQINNSLTGKKGTLRGMHYQMMPSAEIKVVRCISGALYDVILDLRPDSSTFGQWFGETLSADNRTMLYCPRGFAHGFVTLEDDTEAFYLVSDPYAPELERGIRYNDPKFNIEWPVEPQEISDKDSSWPDFDADWHGVSTFKGL